MKRVVGVTLVLAVFMLATGCAALRPSYAIGVDGRHGIAVPALGRVLRFDVVYLRYFPSSLTLRPGDSIRFNLRNTGEPHTVTFGTLVDAAVAALEEFADDATLYEIEKLPEMRKLPRPFARVGSKGIAEMNRAASEPCFLESGEPPTSPGDNAVACRRSTEQPEFTGAQPFYNSGWLSPAETYTMTLDSRIPKGTYSFVCLVHPATMRGTIEVVGPNEERPPPGEPKRRAEGRRGEPGEEEAAARDLRGAGNVAAAATARSAVAGVPASDKPGDYLATFGPPEYRVSAGETVTWTLFGLHSISFNASGEALRGILLERDARVVFNAAAWAAVDSRRLPSDEAVRKQALKGKSFLIDGGEWDGKGSFSSGVIFSRTPGAVTYSRTFTRAGMYSYACLVHPRMKGKLVVE